MIYLDNVTYYYPETAAPALQALSLEIEAGEFVLLVGQSGAGKSTVLRLLNGLVPHFSGGRLSGTVRVAGHDVVQEGPQVMSQHVGFVFQNPEAQAVLDQVEPEIAFGLENAAIPPDEMRLRVEEVLDLLDLEPLRARPLVTLSGGERQRVAIAAALALRPQILVLDEPTSQLDPKSAEDVLQALVRLNQDFGLTIILAEHRLERVLPYVDRLVCLENGQLTADGDVDEVIEEIAQVPPLVELGRKLGWRPVPLTIKAGRRFARKWVNGPASGEDRQPITNGQRFSSSTNKSPLLQVQEAWFEYGRDVAALRGVDVQLRAGEVVALMGRNGSGKTTLLRGIVNLLRFDGGQVQINGRLTDNRSTAEICREVAYLPQNPDDLLFAETVREELWQTLRNHGLSATETAVDKLLAEVGLSEVAEAYPRDLSVGQRQRVALAAVMVTNPKLLLLDEPTRGLDYEAKAALVSLWQRWQQQGMGMLLVTHDVELVAQVANRVVVLSQGEVIAAGPTAEVLTASPLFAPQMAKLFPDKQWLTVADVVG